MTKQLSKPNVEEDLNRLHNISLTKGQIDVVYKILTYYIESVIDTSDDDNYEDDGYTYKLDYLNDVDNIVAVLEPVVDTYYNNKGD